MIGVMFCYIATLFDDTTLVCAFLLLASIFTSLAYFTDYALLLPELWKLHDRTGLFSAVFVLATKFGYVLGFLIPMSFNFIQLIISLNVILMATAISLNYHIGLF